MGIRLTSTERVVAMFDSVNGIAFGPVFDDELEAEDFLEFAKQASEGRGLRDLREATPTQLEQMHADFVKAREEEERANV